MSTEGLQSAVQRRAVTCTLHETNTWNLHVSVECNYKNNLEKVADDEAFLGKSSESVQRTITGPCLRMRHRPSA